MPRISRNDRPGSWHHVFNRAIARRTLFESSADYRFFLAKLARAVRRGEIEVHAYSLMGTHYHLLLRSPKGMMAEAMQRIQLAYSRWFNRARQRDGTLVRGRYRSKPVRSLCYRRQLVRYIDFNPCSAQIVERPSDYRWGSARHYSRRGGPPWLERGWIESTVAIAAGRAQFEPQFYDRAFPTRGASELDQLVEARLEHEGDQDFLDDIVGAADVPTRAWMTRKAILADGTQPGLPLLSLSFLRLLIEEQRSRPWTVKRGNSQRDGWCLVYIGLARDLCGATLDRLAGELGFSTTKVRRLYLFHRAEFKEQTRYASVVVSLARHGIEAQAGVQPGQAAYSGRGGVWR